jgi:23S rRNA (guanosine2251-2'-O)-methyltransferase
MPYFKTDLSRPIAIIMGSEEDGISKNILEASTQSVSIPMQGKTDSLNVSVASAIVMFDALRQRSI